MEAIDSAPRRPRRNSFRNKYSTDKATPAVARKVSTTSDPATLIQEFRKELKHVAPGDVGAALGVQHVARRAMATTPD